MYREEKIHEIDEAAAAADRALMNLRQAAKELDSASSWGIWDMLGGGLISTLCKHSRIDDAKESLEAAKSSLSCLRKELADIDIPDGIEINIGEFLTFADYFFDGLLADWMVQSRIGEASRQVEEAIARVEAIRRKLREWRTEAGG